MINLFRSQCRRCAADSEYPISLIVRQLLTAVSECAPTWLVNFSLELFYICIFNIVCLIAWRLAALIINSSQLCVV